MICAVAASACCLVSVARDDAMIEFWFEHGCTEGKAVELILEYGI